MNQTPLVPHPAEFLFCGSHIRFSPWYKIYSSRSRFFLCVCSSLFCTRSSEEAAGLALSLGFLPPARATKSKREKKNPALDPQSNWKNIFSRSWKVQEAGGGGKGWTPNPGFRHAWREWQIPRGKCNHLHQLWQFLFEEVSLFFCPVGFEFWGFCLGLFI